MVNRSFVLVAFVGLCLAGGSQATPAPEPKPAKKPPEASIEVKPVPGMTEADQATLRQAKLHLFHGAVLHWILKPSTELPGLSEPYSVPTRTRWMEDHFSMAYVKGTGILRITYRAGTPQEAAALVNTVAKKCVAAQEECVERARRVLESTEKLLANSNPASNNPVLIRMRKHDLKMRQELRKWLAGQPRVRLLEQAPMPPPK